MTEAQVDPALVDPTRLAIVSLLSSTKWVEFAFVRDTVGLSDSALSKQIAKLEGRDYVEAKRGYVGKRPRTWLALTKTGREALDSHLSALQNIVAASRRTGESYSPGADQPG
ncbi:winged helix-turn-helix domain-containing protein [Streptomyces sp. NPDC048514]|uniref:winged helix-turn-helix domain-containing protein n=1 Tax=Streptomyces sp. NPDC048514 TaxID=3365564 RepID=UPI0037133475